MAPKKRTDKSDKKVTRYTYDEVKEPRTPETGHTALLPADEQVVTLPMDNGWSKAIQVGKLPEGDERPVVVDMDPAADPVLFWAGKRSKREVPVLPLQRNEIVSDSRIAQIIERARGAAAEEEPQARQGSLFADLEKTLRETDRSKRVEFYTHEESWKNKLICGDSLPVMESLLHYEGMRGKVQMIYVDPPYGIGYDSNFQQRLDTTENDEDDKSDDVLTIKAFRDTWQLGIHSYLSYLQERLYLCRELLSDSGSIFVQISDSNVHLVRSLMDEVFGRQNAVSMIVFTKTKGQVPTNTTPVIADYILHFCKNKPQLKYHALYREKILGEEGTQEFRNIELPDGTIRRITDAEYANPGVLPGGAKIFATTPIVSDGFSEGGSRDIPLEHDGKTFTLRCGPKRHWTVGVDGTRRLWDMGRLLRQEGLRIYKSYVSDFPYSPLTNIWSDMRGETDMNYVVQTNRKVVQRCLLMSTEPADLVLDITCGGGTTAFVSEQWGRRWITCDTSRVAINRTRARLLSAVFPHFKTVNGRISGGLLYQDATKVTRESLAHGREPENILLVDRPEEEKGAVRVAGPFEIMSLGRYSVEDWKGYVVREQGVGLGEPAKLENYLEVICRLYRKDAAIQGASGLVHAVAETEKEKIAISVGPLSGRVTAKQINDAVQDALASGILAVHVLGWAFEANVGEVKSQLEARGKVRVELIMIRPDTLAEGLKATQPEMLFSPLALPDIEVKLKKNGKGPAEAVVTLNGVALFDRKRRQTEYKHADSGYISAWYIDEDYDGDCFVDCQMFFDFKKAPNLKAALKEEVDPGEYKLQLTSQPFAVRGYKRIAVKVVDVYGNESTVVHELK
jgi:adenine-specific DNA-methyltransferase